jgi:7-cyano-7-deazaguanine synthase
MPLTRLEFGMRDVYPASHWALQGTPPAYDTPDEDVYLHGRNVALLSKAAVYAATRKISRIVVAPLAGNPFPDATPQFFAALNTALSLGLAAPIEVSAPFAHLHKEDVVKIGADLGVPFELTLSCMNPSGLTHCGLCSKCRERRDAFQAAGVKDPTKYANVSPR